jgi:hypothetical protein
MYEAIPLLPQYVFMAWCLFLSTGYICMTWYFVKHRDIFTFNQRRGIPVPNFVEMLSAVSEMKYMNGQKIPPYHVFIICAP